MNSKDLIKQILTMDLTQDKIYTPMICLRSARFLSGNNLETGVREDNNINEDCFKNLLYHPNQFSGLACYLIFLEMIGLIFKPKGEKPLKNINAIHRALTHFGGELKGVEISAIRALRNSLAHNFGLAIKNNNKKYKDTDDYNLTHKFQLNINSSTNDIVIFPKQRWFGDFSDKSDDTLTIINEKNLIQLIENIYQKLLSMNEKGELELALDEDQLNARFSIVI